MTKRIPRWRRVGWRAAVVAAFACTGVPAMLTAQSSAGTPRLMQGPMVGAASPSTVTLWGRASGEFPVTVRLAEDPDFVEGVREMTRRARRDDDYVVRFSIGGLRPATEYHYEILVGGEVDRYLAALQPFRTKTAPDAGAPAVFSVGFGSCARIQEDPVQPIWEQVSAHAPDLFFWTGDNIYGDALDPGILAEEYRRQRSVPSLQPVLHSTPQLAVWDDHDFGLNNHDRTNPVKEEALEVFRSYWANPAYGTPSAPGVYFQYAYGGVDFFFVDVRYHRDPNATPDEPGKTMLGEAQLQWLREGLLASDAPFKVIVSGSGWTVAKRAGGDSWASFTTERDRLFDFIRDEEIAGVVLLSGDTHVGELHASPWSERGGYDFYDLVSSPLAQSTTDSWLQRRPEIRIRPVFFAGPNFGLVTFDTTKDDPELRFTLVGEDGRRAWEPFVLRASELKNGEVSWPDKIATESMERLQRYRNGGAYYRGIGR